MALFQHRRFRIGAALVAALFAAHPAWAGPSVIRDSEIETDIKKMAAPIWRAAGLNPSDVGIYLVDDKQINSFVAGGQAIFINTGLLFRAQNSNQLLGVIAHETGHIAGGHVLRSEEAMKNASIEGILAMVLAAGASVAGRSSVPMMGAGGVAQRSFMAFSTSQEATADHAALTFLDRAGESSRGLLKFFEILSGEEMLSGEHQDPWVRTHPFTQDRVEYVRHHVETSRYSNAPEPPGDAEMFHTIQVKLHAFLDTPAGTLTAYPDSDNSMLGRYARAIAYYRIPKLDKAVPLIEGLVRDYPNNPYFRELQGQMLFENGRVREAVAPYEAAVRLAPDAALLRISLSQVYIETGDATLNKRAIAYLNDASRAEGRDSQVWHFLAVAYGRDNQMGMAALSLAEQALANGKKKSAIQEAKRAQQLLPRDRSPWMRAQEIQTEADHLDD